MQNINPTLQILLNQFNGSILIPLAQASQVISISKQTAYNHINNGTYPIRTINRRTRIFIHINDLANYIESLSAPLEAVVGKNTNQRGRPPKLSKMKK